VSQNLDLEGIPDARPVAPARSLVEKFSSAWRNGGAIGVLGRGWQRTLRFIHEDCVERVLGRHEVIPTGGTQSLTSLRITGPNADLGAYYDPTPRLVIRALLSIPAPAQDWALVDIGSGRGRVLQEACRKPFRKVIGVEFATELYEAGRENISAMPADRVKCGGVTVLNEDATTFEAPEGNAAYFLYNPFQEAIMKRFLDHILQDATAQSRGETLFIYVNPVEKALFENNPRIERVPLPMRLRTSLALASIHDVAVYRATTT
jgi:16S rRNA G966 N2-methylase RsmD